MNFRISSFLSLGGDSIICFPVLFNATTKDNYSYIWIQERDFRISRFAKIEMDGFSTILPKKINPWHILNVGFAEGDMSFLSVYSKELDEVFMLDSENYSSILANYFPDLYLQYDFYYINSAFEAESAYLEKLKSAIDRPMSTPWSSAETRFVQKRNTYWESISSDKVTASYPSFSLQDYLNSFASSNELVNWLEQHRFSDSSLERSKWSKLFIYSYINGIIDYDMSNIFASDYLTYVGAEDRNFKSIFDIVRYQYDRGAMYDLKEYIIDYVRDASEGTELFTYGELFGFYNFVADLLIKDVVSHHSYEAKDVIRVVSDLYQIEYGEIAGVDIDPYSPDWLILSLIQAIEKSGMYVGLSGQIICFIYSTIESHVVNVENSRYLLRRLMSNLENLLMPKFMDGLLYSDQKFLSKLWSIEKRREKFFGVNHGLEPE